MFSKQLLAGLGESMKKMREAEEADAAHTATPSTAESFHGHLTEELGLQSRHLFPKPAGYAVAHGVASAASDHQRTSSVHTLSPGSGFEGSCVYV